ncbi:predicted protein [Nematostella vectensis]|uniref:G-protein coupled receptors family 1 profile domain-containing protein n=1 Tax=Nematostella vectensis TaxID=45351 RepID=A7S7Y4_NEMVE|nr:predicted protein [Nematostella vectensis]|eukprot:XP_001632218.1 predicted protein [Nematostella vectensis]
MPYYNFSCYHFTKWVEEDQITQTEFAIIAVLNGVTILPAIILNALVLVSIWRTPALHTPAMVLLGNLALSDFAVGIIAQPVLAAWTALELRASERPHTYCDVATLYGITSTGLGAVSLFSITAVAVDRFLALHLHLRYKAIVTIKKAIVVCAVNWLFAVLSGVWWIIFGVNSFNVILCCVMGICAIIIMASYVNICNVVHQHRNQIQVVPAETSCIESCVPNVSSNIKYRKSVRTSLYIYFAFVLCYIPCFAAFLYYGITADNSRSGFFVKVTTTIVLMNSGINPAIYCWKMKELRCAVRSSAHLLGIFFLGSTLLIMKQKGWM